MVANFLMAIFSVLVFLMVSNFFVDADPKSDR
jgi:uncharacterized membrane protein YwzB